MYTELTVNGLGIIKDILDCSYSFIRPIDPNGKPKGQLMGGDINLLFDSSLEENHAFFKWICDQEETKSGKIEFYESPQSDSPFKTLNFSEAYLVQYAEDAEKTRGNLADMLLRIGISAMVVQMGGKTYENINM